MGKQFQRIAVMGRHSDARVAETMHSLLTHLAQRAVDVVASESLPGEFKVARLPENQIAATVDLIIAIGGDGTILYAARLASDHKVPLLGINRGRLGFLADVTPDEMLQSVDQVLTGNYTRDSRLQLTASLRHADGSTEVAVALNDVVLQRIETGRMVDFETRIGDHYVNTHAGDGLIIATPTGSTAYALSCGGPIIEPGLDAIVVVPVCPHTLTDRPIVVSAAQPIDIRLLRREDTKSEITVDGRTVSEIQPDDLLRISTAPERITLIHPPGYDFYGILRSKLYWGRDSRLRYEQDSQSC
ncbi:MAG TPA: NAD(+) kinase [Woeseiaceae bacterium]|nr:NAD(+) kinase [Woeseiaceae bacterium]